MPKASKTFYGVQKGRTPGVYTKWEECQSQTKGFSKAVYKGFKTQAEAEAFVHGTTSASSISTTSPYSRPTAITEVDVNTIRNSPEIETGSMEQEAQERGWTVVYTDGACSNNGRQEIAKGGIGVWWGANDTRNVSERCPGDQTNNRAELIAIIRALETDTDPRAALLIKTDSKYSISCIRDWLPKWRKNGFRTANGQDIKNRAVILYLAARLDDRPGKTKLEYVKGHAGILGNEQADRLACNGANRPVVPERDWTVQAPPAEPNGVDFSVPEGFFLSEDELAAMERDQVFD